MYKYILYTIFRVGLTVFFLCNFLLICHQNSQGLMDQGTTFQKFHTNRIPAFYLALCLLYTYFQIRKTYLLKVLRDLCRLYSKWMLISTNQTIHLPGVRCTKWIVLIILFCGISEHLFFEV